MVEDSIRACVAEYIAAPKEKKEESESEPREGEQQLSAGQHPCFNLYLLGFNLYARQHPGFNFNRDENVLPAVSAFTTYLSQAGKPG